MKSRSLFLQKALSWMFGKILSSPLQPVKTFGKNNRSCASEYGSELPFKVKDVSFLNQFKY